jgi:hypothetical protein
VVELQLLATEIDREINIGLLRKLDHGIATVGGESVDLGKWWPVNAVHFTCLERS